MSRAELGLGPLESLDNECREPAEELEAFEPVEVCLEAPVGSGGEPRALFAPPRDPRAERCGLSAAPVVPPPTPAANGLEVVERLAAATRRDASTS